MGIQSFQLIRPKTLELSLDSFLSLNLHVQIIVKKPIGPILSQPPMLPPCLPFNFSLDYCMSLLTLPLISHSLPSSHSQLTKLSNPLKPECIASLMKPPFYSHFTLSKSHSPYSGLKSPCDLNSTPAHHYSVLSFCFRSLHFIHLDSDCQCCRCVSPQDFSPTLLSTSGALPADLRVNSLPRSIFRQWGFMTMLSNLPCPTPSHLRMHTVFPSSAIFYSMAHITI